MLCGYEIHNMGEMKSFLELAFSSWLMRVRGKGRHRLRCQVHSVRRQPLQGDTAAPRAGILEGREDARRVL